MTPPYPKALERFPHLRQSLLSSFDLCALQASFSMELEDGWSTHPQARGTIFHTVAKKAMQEMAAQGESQIDPDTAQALLIEALRQDDVDRVCPTAGCGLPVERKLHSRTVKAKGFKKGMPYIVCAKKHKHHSDLTNIPMKEVKDLWWTVTKWAYDNSWDIDFLVDVEQRLNTTIEYPDGHGGHVSRIITGQLDALFSDRDDETHAIVIDYKDAQPLDARILTPDGWTTMGALSIGDMVVGADGKPTEVIGVHPKGERLVYEVEMTDGAKTRCCDHHFWTVRRGVGHKWQTKRLREIIGDEKRPGAYWQIPALEPVEFAPKGPQPLDAYLLGVLLGDGCFPLEEGVGLTCADDEILDAVRARVPDGIELRHQARYNWRLPATSRTRPNPLRAGLRELGLLGCKAAEKFVPDAYLYGTPDQRFDLLCGLMDTDGSISKHNQMSFSSASPEMAQQVQFLVRSLGGVATIKKWVGTGNHDVNVVYLRMTRPPFKLSRKRDRWRMPKRQMTRGIRSITPLKVEHVQCIEVAAADHLYVTDDLILTHNT